MKIDFLKSVDLTNTDEATKEMLQKMSSEVNEGLESFLKPAITKKEVEDIINEAIKGLAGNDSLENVKSALLEIKSKMEKGNIDVPAVKTLEQQIEEQLKEFITVNKNGVKMVDMKEACKASAGYKKTLNLVINVKEESAAVTPVMSNQFAHYGNIVDPVLSVAPRAQTIIRQYANVAPAAGRSLTYAEYESTGEAEWTEEGKLKPKMSANLTEKTVTAGKVALTCKLTEETLTDLPQLVAEIRAEIINKIGVKEEEGILNGSGSNGEIKGVGGDMPAFSLTTLKVANANFYDAIVGSYTQIVSVSNMAYRPNAVMVHPVDYAKMQLEKDVNGNYLRPFKVGDELIPGLAVVTSTAIAQGEFIMGDFNYLNIRDLWELSITFGWENDDFTKNLVTMVGEKRLMAYIKGQYKTAFVKDSFATVVAAMTKSE